MASVLNDDIRYVKLILLLVKGGTFVAKRLILKNLDKSIDDFLKDNEEKLTRARSRRHITEKQIHILFPGTRTDLDCWDISLYSYILLNLFDDKLENDDKIAIKELRDKRNELAHSGSTILSEVQFSGEWTRLTLVLLQLAKKLITAEWNEINVIVREISTIQDFSFATNELKSFEGSDEFVQNTITEMMKSIDQRLKDIVRRLDHLERERIRNEDTRERPQEITARMTATASTSLKRDAAQAELLNATQRCVSRKQDQSKPDQDQIVGDGEVLVASNNLFSDMREQGVDIVKVEEGSVMVTFRCSTLSALKNITQYLADGVYEGRLIELENTLSKYLGSPVKLNISIVLETLYSALEQIEEDDNNKAIVITMECKGSEGVKNAIDCFGNGSSTNALNSLSEALSRSVGQRVELHTTIDVDKLEKDVKELERQLILDDQTIVHELPKRMETSLKLSTTNVLPDEIEPTEGPMDAWTKQSSPYLSQKRPQLSKYSHEATLYRQQPFAVGHTTGLAFTTETCKKHSRHSFYVRRIESWLKQTDRFSECELLKSRSATLTEIESCYPDVDKLSRATSKLLLPLIELPCGCFENRWSRHYIPVDALGTAGCVIDMAYMVGTGKLKNGLVLELEHPFLRYEKQFLLSYAAIAAKQMKEKSNMKKILIFELNSSNGANTQRTTYDDKAILYISIHDRIPWHSYQEHGESHECGSQNAEGFNVNIQLNAFASDVDYLAAFRNIFMPIARDFNPEIVFVLREFDDKKSFELGFDYMTRELMSLAFGKVVFLANGNRRYLERVAEMILKTFLGKDLTPIKEDQYRPRINTLQALERTMNIQLKYWPCLQSHLSTIQSLLFEAQKEENIRQDMSAVRYNFHTALSINTETCPEHGVHRYYLEDFDRLRRWLKRNKVIPDCELIRSRSAKLQAIQSYYIHSDVFHQRKPMKLSELPCGCFEDGTTRKRIPVDVLHAAGCVTDMAYRVGSGIHKNGLVFVQDQKSYFNKESNRIPLNFIEIAAEQMKENLDMKRILIFQWNSSHRMSTQRAAYNDKAILYISLNKHTSWDPNQLPISEEFNVKIVFGTCSVYNAEYLAAFRYIVMPIAREFNPEIVLAFGGVDFFGESGDVGSTTSDLMSLANGKVVFVLANIRPDYEWISKQTEMCLKALQGEDITPVKKRHFSLRTLQYLERNIQNQRKYWPCLQKYLSEIEKMQAEYPFPKNTIYALYEADRKTWEHRPVSSLLEGRPEPSMVSSTDAWTTHDTSDPIVKGPRLKMEHGTNLVSASDTWTTHDTSEETHPIVKRLRLKMEHGTNLVSASDTWTTHDTSEETHPIVEGLRLNMEHRETSYVKKKKRQMQFNVNARYDMP